MRILWGRANSSNVMKVIWLLEELGLSYERRDAGGAFGGTDTPHYRDMNPMGLVPALEEDGFALFESNAILRYLVSAHAPTSPLWPQDARVRGRVDQWMDWQQTILTAPMRVVFMGLVRTEPAKRDMAAIEKARTDLSRFWAVLDTQLARHPFVAGDAFTLADISCGVHVHRWFSFDLARPDLLHLAAWYERLKTRPAFTKHVANPMT